MSKEQIRVLIADDHPMMGEALKLWLEKQEDISVVGSATSGRQTLSQLAEKRPDVLLLDVKMPDMDGLQVLSALTSFDHKPIVLMLTSYPTSKYLSHSLTLGAAGFLSKDMGLHRIPQAIREALNGKTVVDRAATQETFESSRRIVSTKTEHQEQEDIALADEQIQLLTMLAEGMSNTAIGEKLLVSPRTVRTKLARLYSTIGVKHRVQAVVWAISQGLVPGS